MWISFSFELPTLQHFSFSGTIMNTHLVVQAPSAGSLGYVWHTGNTCVLHHQVGSSYRQAQSVFDQPSDWSVRCEFSDKHSSRICKHACFAKAAFLPSRPIEYVLQQLAFPQRHRNHQSPTSHLSGTLLLRCKHTYPTPNLQQDPTIC